MNLLRATCLFFLLVFASQAVAEPLRVVCIGDSITQGNGRPTWRYPLWKTSLERGWNLDFIGSTNRDKNNNVVSTAPHLGLPFDGSHEARWGWRVDELRDALPAWLAGYPAAPHLALIHAGSNDAFNSQSTASTITELTEVIAHLRSANPKIAIIIAQIIPATDAGRTTRVSQLNTAILAALPSWNTPASPVVSCDAFTGFDPAADTYDGVHPNATGEAKIAAAFASVLPSVLTPLHATTYPSSPETRRRIFITTDLGGDSDDQSTLVRFLLYSNEFDIVGLGVENEDTDNPPLPTTGGPYSGVDLMHLYLDAYQAAQTNLRLHDPRYPDHASLRPLVKPSWDTAGRDGLSSSAEALLAQLENTDPRPLWVIEWGSYPGHTIAVVQAMRWIVTNRTGAARTALLNKLHFATIDERQLHDAIGHAKPGRNQNPGKQADFGLFIGTGRGIIDKEPLYAAGGKRFTPGENIESDHGLLGSYYQGIKEGDSNGVIYLLPTGLNDPLQPTWGSGWAGRFAQNNQTVPTYPPNYYGVGWKSTDSDFYPGDGVGLFTDSDLFPRTSMDVSAWSIDATLDFYSRADWIVAPFSQANHPPVPIINGDATRAFLHRTHTPGTTHTFDASASSDPDGNPLTYQWRFYPAAGTYTGSFDSASISGADTATPTITLPSGMAPGQTVHLLLRVTDNDAHRAGLNTAWYKRPMPLSRYRRVIFTQGETSTPNNPPVISAASATPASVTGTDTVLSVSATDPDAQPLTYSWSVTSQPSGSTPSFSNPSVSNPTLTFDRAGVYIIEVTVSDGQGGSDTESVSVTVDQSPSSLILSAAR